MTKSRNIGQGKVATKSSFEKLDGTLRAHLVAAENALEEGQPRMFVRFHIYEARRVLTESKHMPCRDGTRVAFVSDSV